MNKLIILLFITLISRCIYSQDSFSSSTWSYSSSSSFSSSSTQDELITYLPYDNQCNNLIGGIGFGLKSMTCLTNTTTGSIFSFDLYEPEYVNLTSSHWGYCSDPISTQIFKVGSCGYYRYSNSNYLVSRSTGLPNIPKNSYLIQGYDSTCSNIQNFMYAPNNTVVQDFKQNLQTTYQCINNIPYINECIDNLSNDNTFINSNCNQTPTSSICSEDTNYISITCVV